MFDKPIILVGANGFWSLRDFINAEVFKNQFELVWSKDFNIENDLCDHVVVVVVADQPFGLELMEKFPNLKTIARTGTGYDNIDLEAARAKNVIVTRVAGVNAESVSDFALALVFALSRNIVKMHDDMLSGKWKQLRQGTLITEMDLGIVGLGHIGRSIAKKFHALNARRILGYNRTLRPEVKKTINDTNMEFCSINNVMAKSDMVVVALALNKETRDFIGLAELSLMKPEACLINTSRGAVVDENTLAEFVAERRIAGVALDVFSKEPPTDNFFNQPFLQKLVEASRNGANVILTSHNAGITKNSVKNISLRVAKNIIGVLDGNLDGIEIVTAA